MKIKFVKQYISISKFDSIEINDFSVLTGKNGSGKTHLLNAIKQGSVEIEGIDKSEIVYYNYNDFTVYTGNLQQNSKFQNRLNSWDNEKKKFLDKIQNYRSRAIQSFAQKNTTSEQTIINFFRQPNFKFDELFGIKKDFELIEEFKKEQNVLDEILNNQQSFTPKFFQFIQQYLQNAKGDIDDINYDELKEKFVKAQKTLIQQSIYNFARQPNFNFEQDFGNKKDFELIEQYKKEQNARSVILNNRHSFSPKFFQFLQQYLQNAKGDIDEINYNKLKTKFAKAQESLVQQLIYNFAQQPNFNFEQDFGNKKDYELIEKCKKEQNFLNEILNNQQSFTPKFFQFIQQYLQNAKADIDDINYDELKKKFVNAQESIERYLSEEDEDLYKFLKSSVKDKSILNLNSRDFESPNLFLEDIANEEKEYQLKKTQNSLNKIQATEYNKNIKYLDSGEFIEQNGLSPVEQINNVLSEYDCNGYYLFTNQNQNFLGVDKKNISIRIGLTHSDKGYTTNFDQLSSGEKTLIALSLFIYKTRKNRITPRVLLLDEVDSSLHPSMINRLLNVLENLFIEEQGFKVIMATHSPTTVALSPEESIYIIQKNGELKIKKELKSNVINILTEGIATINNEDTYTGINYNISNTELPILFTEGITDKIILETAWYKLFETNMPFFIQDCFDASFLGNLFKRAEDGQDGIFLNYPEKTFISLFDFDQEGYNVWNGLRKKYSLIEENPKKALTIKHKTKNAYAVLLPVPENKSILKQVIKADNDTYENESILPIELLFYGVSSLDKFFKKEKVKGGGEVIVFKGRKRDFANSLNELSKEDFKNLLPIFEKVKGLIDN